MKNLIAISLVLTSLVIASCSSTTPKEYVAEGDRLQTEGRYAEAVTKYTKAIELDPRLAEAYHKRAGAYVGQSQFLQAIADATRAIDIDPNLFRPYQLRGMSYLLLGRQQEAKADLEKVLTLTDDPAIVTLVEAILRTLSPAQQ